MTLPFSFGNSKADSYVSNYVSKIRYRLVYNYANRLNRNGCAPVSVECRQNHRKIYVSTNVMLEPHQWNKGLIVNHGNADKLTVYLIKLRNSIEEVELNALLKGKRMSLSQLRMAIKSGLHESASLKEFAQGVIENSDRKASTKRGYEYMIKELDSEYGRLTLDDITYDWILRWKTRMRDKGLSDNTVKGKLKQLKAVINEAIKRGLVNDDPFKFITIGHMQPKVAWLNMKEIRKIEKVPLKGRDGTVRDLFLLSSFTGLRWSDLATLEEAEIKDGMMRKVMKKTNHEVSIPIGTLFWGKGLEIINKYTNVRKLSRCCCNATANKIMKQIAEKAGVNKPISFHWARKSFSSNLQLMGMSLGDVSTLLGHKDSRITSEHYSFSKDQVAAMQSKRLFKQTLGKYSKNEDQTQETKGTQGDT